VIYGVVIDYMPKKNRHKNDRHICVQYMGGGLGGGWGRGGWWGGVCSEYEDTRLVYTNRAHTPTHTHTHTYTHTHTHPS
jgi:hypothetical protein